MKLINTSKNTLYIEDLDLHIPYKEGEIEEVSPDRLKKSRCLRNFIINGMLEVIEYNKNERIENSLMYFKNKMEDKQKEQESPEEIYSDTEHDKDTIELNIHGIFYDAGGYGKVNRNLAMNLVKAGFKVRITPKRSQNQLNKDELSEIITLEKTKISRNHISIDSIIPSFAEASSGKYKVLYTTIESYTVPKQFIESCRMYQEIWVTSEWSASILRKYTDQPVYCVPTGADINIYTEKGPKLDFRPNINKFVFVSVFGWNYRKGYDVLLKSYFDEFRADDDVSLLIMSRYQTGTRKFHRNKIRDDIDEIMREFPNKDLPHVVRYSQILPENQMPQLYRACDCFVLPSRGEGGNLCAPEASMCGLPIIMTNCSGQQGYLRQDNSYMIEIDKLVETQPGQFKIHYWDGQKFPALTSKSVHDQLRKAMRSAYENYSEAKEKNKRMQKLILEKFTWKHTAESAAKRLNKIYKKIRGQ